MTIGITKMYPLYVPLCSPSLFSAQIGLETILSLEFGVFKIWKEQLEVSFITEIPVEFQVALKSQSYVVERGSLTRTPTSRGRAVLKILTVYDTIYQRLDHLHRGNDGRKKRSHEETNWLISCVGKLEKLMLRIAHQHSVFLTWLREQLLGKESSNTNRRRLPPPPPGIYCIWELHEQLLEYFFHAGLCVPAAP